MYALKFVPEYQNKTQTRGDRVQEAVKSAARVFEVLELLDDLRRPATVSDVVQALGYPQSSTSILLKSMAKCGYLDHDSQSRTYVTSARVALLGAWVDRSFVRDGPLITIMNELNRATGDTIVLIDRSDLHCQYIHVIQAINPARLHFRRGSARPLVASGGGYALLSRMSDEQIFSILHRSNYELTADRPIRRADLMSRIAKIRSDGYAFNCDTITAGGGILAAPIPCTAKQHQLAIGIGGISQALKRRETELARLIKAAVASYCQCHGSDSSSSHAHDLSTRS